MAVHSLLFAGTEIAMNIFSYICSSTPSRTFKIPLYSSDMYHYNNYMKYVKFFDQLLLKITYIFSLLSFHLILAHIYQCKKYRSRSCGFESCNLPKKGTIICKCQCEAHIAPLLCSDTGYRIKNGWR
jgi:hypothetical protein